MARFSVTGKRTSSGLAAGGFLADVVNASTVMADIATVSANVATLVADGASPTQAHVTTLNTNWTTLKADIAKGDLSAPTTDVILSFDAAGIVTNTKLRQVVADILKTIEGSGALTP